MPYKNPPQRSALLAITGGACIVVLAGLLLAAGIAVDGMTDRLHKADVAIVLGNRVNPDGRPSSWLQARLDKTVEMYQKGFFLHIIVSGGFGKEGFDEADVMKAYLVSAGIPAGAILEDHYGVDTYSTALNSSSLMSSYGWKSAFVISQYYQIPRTKLALRRFGVSELYSAHAQGLTTNGLISLAREVIAYPVYFVRSY
ncbi:MAG: YdcF family protein [Anaerolineaceae bacterium]|nr:YdcF family protein [Anaerolineaceae bacterium]